jgi:glutathione S-transferase
MALEIFWGSGSPFSWRVLLGAEIKGLVYESLSILEYFEDKSPDVPLFLRSAGAGPPGRAMTPNELEETAKAAQRELKAFEERISGGSWLVGEEPSIRLSAVGWGLLKPCRCTSGRTHRTGEPRRRDVSAFGGHAT